MKRIRNTAYFHVIGCRDFLYPGLNSCKDAHTIQVEVYLLLYVQEVLSILYSDSLYKNGLDFLDIQYFTFRPRFADPGYDFAYTIFEKKPDPGFDQLSLTFEYVYLNFWSKM